MDAVYVCAPYWNSATRSGDPTKGISTQNVYSPANRTEYGMPDPDELMDKYSSVMDWDPRKDKWEIAQIFHHMRGGTITHGIQARTISGQASSELSHVYFENTRRSLDAAIRKVRELKQQSPASSKL